MDSRHCLASGVLSLLLVNAAFPATGNWSNPGPAMSTAVAAVEASGVHDAHADYRFACALDYLIGGRVAITDPIGDRWVAEYFQVSKSADPARIFFAPGQSRQVAATFSSSAPGPDGYPEPLRLDPVLTRRWPGGDRQELVPPRFGPG